MILMNTAVEIKCGIYETVCTNFLYFSFRRAFNTSAKITGIGNVANEYSDNAIVKNSLISDGCEIEGIVENSILFRGVKVGKGAIVRNSIVMQDNIIGENTALDCVITDKNVVITSKRHLSGCEDLPYIIQKGKHL